MDNSKLVYSTESGNICPKCERQIKKCVCKKKQAADTKSDGIVRIRREVKGRKGKTATVLYGFSIKERELCNLAKDLKTQCGTGGSVKDGTIIIQGDHREKVMSELINRGFNVKLAGG
jgi:translation initiation factor 1